MDSGIEAVVQDCFHTGLKYTHIVQTLHDRYNVVIGIRQLKRVLQRLGLHRRKNYSDPDDVISFIASQLVGSGSLHGYRWMHMKCLQHGHKVPREDVRIILNHLNPELVEKRRRRRLSRRTYFAKGPNFIWHIDGYDKLKPFGLCISGCIDGYSRRIMWLKVGSTNNNPHVIGGYYLATLKEVGGCPEVVRTDFGTENVVIRDIQRSLAVDYGSVHGPPCYIAGTSTTNQRIESWWGMLRRQCIQHWMDAFTYLKDNGDFDGSFLDKALLQFCFMEKIQCELNEVRNVWNSHYVRRSRECRLPGNRPNAVFSYPELWSTRSYLREFTDVHLDIYNNLVTELPYVCDEDVYKLCCYIMYRNNLQMPLDSMLTMGLYIHLREVIKDMLR